MRTIYLAAFFMFLVSLAKAVPAEPVNTPPAALAPHSENGVSYVSGGVGADERDALKAMAKDYNLRLLFADKKTGSYQAGVKVAIADTKGRKVVDAVSDGPWFYAKLPPGRYRVTADADGKTVTRRATIGAGHSAHLDFRLP